jgi:signal transduction histidine kinase/ligand-binding sensor domain-containing protein
MVSQIQCGELSASSLKKSYVFEDYNRMNGLNTVLIKAILRTDTGDLLVGSDNDLFRFNGMEWQLIPPSRSGIRVKNLFQRRNGDIILATDERIYRISIVDGVFSAEPYFPNPGDNFSGCKGIYETRDGALWLTTSDFVCKIEDEAITRFEIPHHELSGRAYLRDHFILEGFDDEIAVLSFSGRAYQLTGDSPEEIEWSGPSEISSALQIGSGEYYLATDRGIEKVSLKAGMLSQPEVLVAHPDISDLAIDQKGVLYATTYLSGFFEVDLSDESPSMRLIRNFDDYAARLFVDDTNAIWLMMENRIVRCRPSRVRQISDSAGSPFIEHFQDGVVYSQDEKLIWTDRCGNKRKIGEFGSRVLGALSDIDVLYVFTVENEIIKLDLDGKILGSLKLEGTFEDAIVDDQRRIWLTMRGAHQLALVDFPHGVKYYEAPSPARVLTSIIKDGNGNIIVAGNHAEGFLFQYDPEVDQLVNLEAHFPETEILRDFFVTDMAIDSEGRLILSTSQGILVPSEEGFEWMELGSYRTHEFASLNYHSKTDSLWALGYEQVFQIVDREVHIYDRLNGFVSGPLYYRSSIIDEDRFWAATTLSVISIDLTEEQIPTPRPFLYRSVLNSKISKRFPESVGNQDNWSLDFRCPTFPPLSTTFEFTLKSSKNGDILDSVRSKSPQFSPKIEKKGSYILLVRSKEIDNPMWSEPITFRFTVYDEFERWALKFTTLAAAMCWIAVMFVMIRNRSKNKQIELLNQTVEDRTADLSGKNQLLEKSNNVREKLLSIISHDLRGSVGSIANLLPIIREQIAEESSKPVIEDMDLVIREAKATDQLLDNLLVWARYQSVAFKLKIEEVSLLEMVHTMRHLFESRIAAKEIKFNATLEETMVLSDSDCLQLILRNLIGNAIKFSSEGDNIELRSESTDGGTRISVIDTGVGMDEATIQKILDRSEYFTSKGTQNEPGFGLGLSFCIEVLDLLGSKLEVKSAPNEGSTFYFVIPTKN